MCPQSGRVGYPPDGNQGVFIFSNRFENDLLRRGGDSKIAKLSHFGELRKFGNIRFIALPQNLVLKMLKKQISFSNC